MDILTVTFRRDLGYFRILARSVAKYARGFRTWRVVVPVEDACMFIKIIEEEGVDEHVPTVVHTGLEWPGQGFLWHEYEVFTADRRTTAPLILHADADFAFLKESRPQDFLWEGSKPFLCYESFKSLAERRAFDGLLAHWRVAAEAATGLVVPVETMWQQPIVLWRTTHKLAREVIEHRHKTSLEDYVRQQRNEHPQTFAEFTTLGGVAWNLENDRYHWIDTAREERPERRVYQAWSRVPPRAEDIAVWARAGLIS
jgi:hypothetical protein